MHFCAVRNEVGAQYSIIYRTEKIIEKSNEDKNSASMDILDFLARSNPFSYAMSSLGLLLVRLLMVSLALHLCSHAFNALPQFHKLVQQTAGRTVLFVVVVAIAAALVWYIPALRILHEMDLIGRSKSFRLPDIIFSSLVVLRLSYLWPAIFAWLNRQLS